MASKSYWERKAFETNDILHFTVPQPLSYFYCRRAFDPVLVPTAPPFYVKQTRAERGVWTELSEHRSLTHERLVAEGSLDRVQSSNEIGPDSRERHLLVVRTTLSRRHESVHGCLPDLAVEKRRRYAKSPVKMPQDMWDVDFRWD